jgi:hypothetical protein
MRPGPAHRSDSSAAQLCQDQIDPRISGLHTVHWFIPREVHALEIYQQVGTQLDNHVLTKPKVAAQFEAKVIPFWTEARDRFNSIELEADDTLNPKLEKYQEVGERRSEVRRRAPDQLRAGMA